MNPGKIVIDGKTYNSVDEMPADVRRTYEEAMRGLTSTPPAANNPMQILNNVFADGNNNGVPDIIENQQFINLSGGMSFVVDGKTYNSVDDLPPDARARYEQSMGSLDGNRNGMPDFLEGMLKVSNQTAQPAITTTNYTPETTRSVARQPMPVSSPTIEPESSNGWMLAVAALALLFLCAAGVAGIWYFFLR